MEVTATNQPRRGWRPRQPVKARIRCCSKREEQSPSSVIFDDSFPRFTKKKAIAKMVGEALWDNVSFAFPKERCCGNEQIILGEGGGIADG